MKVMIKQSKKLKIAIPQKKWGVSHIKLTKSEIKRIRLAWMSYGKLFYIFKKYEMSVISENQSIPTVLTYGFQMWTFTKNVDNVIKTIAKYYTYRWKKKHKNEEDTKINDGSIQIP